MKVSITLLQHILPLLRKNLAMTFLFFTWTISAFSQSTSSYNANSIVPAINGIACTAFGYGTLQSNTGNSNTANGYQALYSNTSGSSNTANGEQALAFNNSGFNNTAIGAKALYSNTTGYYNTGIGYLSLFSNIYGDHNTGIGYQSLYSNIGGQYNTANGNYSLYHNIGGDNNTANGDQSLYSNTDGFTNTATGAASLYFNNGSNNTANGYRALAYNIGGDHNTALGESAGYLSTGSKNLYLGNLAGYNESTGSNKLYLANDSNKTIMYGDFSTGQVLLGKPTPTGYTFKGTRTLNVVGGIIADSMRVALSNTWADYVFADDYKLKPLEELAKYIKTNKHLPDVPSADEVSKNGIELGSMDAKLLQKIEELQLYILQQQNEITQQLKQNEVQNKSIEILQQQMAELKQNAKIAK